MSNLNELIAKLRLEDKVKDIKSPRYSGDQIPELDLSLFKEDRLDEVRGIYDLLRSHLCDTYTILYHIEDQTERHIYEHELKGKYGDEFKELLTKSLLVVAHLTPVQSNLYWLLDDLREPNAETRRIYEYIMAEWNKGYQHKDDEIKVRFAEMMQDKIYDVLKLLSVEGPAS